MSHSTTLHPFGKRSGYSIPTCLVNHSIPTMHEHSITTFDLCPEPCQPHYTHLHPHPTSTWEVASIIPIYSITHFTVLLRIQLLSMIYWYHNWFYLNYNPTSLPMHSLSFVHHVKGTSCQCPRPTTHLQAMILCHKSLAWSKRIQHFTSQRGSVSLEIAFNWIWLSAFENW